MFFSKSATLAISPAGFIPRFLSGFLIAWSLILNFE
jgi:hypothetical protein